MAKFTLAMEAYIGLMAEEVVYPQMKTAIDSLLEHVELMTQAEGDVFYSTLHRKWKDAREDDRQALLGKWLTTGRDADIDAALEDLKSAIEAQHNPPAFMRM